VMMVLPHIVVPILSQSDPWGATFIVEEQRYKSLVSSRAKFYADKLQNFTSTVDLNIRERNGRKILKINGVHKTRYIVVFLVRYTYRL
jgi:hypothetical protein